MAAKSEPPTIPAFTSYQRLPGIVLGFHGCDRAVGEAILSGKQKHLVESRNDHDWLGPGIYFWENDPRRAMEWAIEASQRSHLSKGQIKSPFVVGAIIDLGFCLNLLSRECLEEVAVAHQFMKEVFDAARTPMPENKGPDKTRRYLDRFVIDSLHASRKSVGLQPYDTVRASFREGDSIYPGAGFDAKSHIQIAVCEKTKIKGYFRPFVD